jgi:hypothetical protein
MDPVTYSEPPRRNADLQSAVPQVCNLLTSPGTDVLECARSFADYKSAIQQTASLRYGTAVAAMSTQGMPEEPNDYSRPEPYVSALPHRVDSNGGASTLARIAAVRQPRFGARG